MLGGVFYEVTLPPPPFPARRGRQRALRQVVADKRDKLRRCETVKLR